MNRSLHTAVTALGRNHYDILGLKSDCTQKEIRDAFVNLSKVHHPDTNQQKAKTTQKATLESNKEFIRVMEAYRVLSKGHSRANYDRSLQGVDTVNYVRKDTYYEPWKVDPMRYTDGSGRDEYYGIKGLKKVKNWKIVVICILFCVAGAMVQGFIIVGSSSMYRSNRQVPDVKSAAYSAEYQETRRKALENGNAVQFENMQKRLKNSYYDE